MIVSKSVMSSIVILLIAALEWAHPTNTESCARLDNNVHGYYFENHYIDLVNVSARFQVTSIFLCKELCGRKTFCKGLSYWKTGNIENNCLLYNQLIFKTSLKPVSEMDSIIVMPMDHSFNPLDAVLADEEMTCFQGMGDKPGSFTFKLESGDYRMILTYLHGGIECAPGVRPIRFGCYWAGIVHPSIVVITKLSGNSKGEIIITADEMDDYEGNGEFTPYLATKSFFYFNKNEEYEVWYWDDYRDHNDLDNLGKTCFEVYAEGKPSS